jgi:5'-3' exonuclease
LTEKVWVNPKRYQDAFGFPPEKHTEMKALAGDRGDSVPSPEGIGEGWAWKLIQRFGSLQGVKDNLDNLDIPRFPVKAKANLKAQWPLVEQALKLVNLRHSAEEEQAIFTADERALLDEVIDRFSEDPKLDVPRIKDMMLEAGKVGMYKAFDIWALPLTGKIIHF